MSRSIFLVIGSEWESSGVLAAFEAKRDADAFAKLCDEYRCGEKPRLPDIEDTPENDALFDKMWKKLQRWQARHPGGKHAHCFDTFSVEKVRLREASTVPSASDSPTERSTK